MAPIRLNDPSRRATLASTLAFSALPWRAALAEAPPAGLQAPGVYRTKVGEIEVTTLFDGELRRPLDDDYVRNAPVEDVRAALESHLLPSKFIDNPYTFTAVNTAGHLALIDVGTGDLFRPEIDQGERSLMAAGINRAEVDSVILTHFHPDHVGGLTSPNGTPLFTNATIYFPAAEMRFLENGAALGRMPQMMRTFATQALGKLAAYEGRLELYEDGDVLARGLRALGTPGHTPGHCAIEIVDADETLIVVGDAITYPAIFVDNPEWHVVFDADGPRAAETRKALLQRARAEGLRLVGTHFPFPSIGRIAGDGDRFGYVPERWQGTLR